MTETQWIVAGGQIGPAIADAQVWTETETGFVSVSYAGKTLAADSRDVMLLGGRVCPRCAKTVLPGTFLFCPDCGAKTEPGEAVGQGMPCHWPSYGGTGWPELPDMAIRELTDRQDVSPPQGGKWGLVAGGDPAVLVAYDHEHGIVLRFDGEAGWKNINRVVPSGLAPWQRALIATKHGFFFPTESEGLGFFAAPFVEGGKWTSSGSGVPLGGPGVYGDMVYLPVLEDGVLQLIGCPLDRAPTREDGVCTSVAVACSGGAVPKAFGAPFTNSAGDLFWSAAEGYIAISPKSGGTGFAFLPWRKGYEARPVARPFRSPRFGGAYQIVLGHDEGGDYDAYAFHQVAASATRQEVSAIDGPHLSYGAGTFRGDHRYDDPFLDSHVDYEPNADNNVYIPLTSFGTGEQAQFLVAIVDGRDKLTDLLSERDLPSSTRATLRLIGVRQGGGLDLHTSVDIRNLHHLSTIVYGDRLFVYANYESRIYSWRIVT